MTLVLSGDDQAELIHPVSQNSACRGKWHRCKARVRFLVVQNLPDTRSRISLNLGFGSLPKETTLLPGNLETGQASGIPKTASNAI